MCLGGQCLEEGACLTGTRKERTWFVGGESYKSSHLSRIKPLWLSKTGLTLSLRLDETQNS